MRRSQLVAGALSLCAVFGASSTWALGGNPDNWCRNGAFPETDFPFLGLARVTTSGKVNFIKDFYPECPTKPERCQGRAYLVPGDIVATGHSYGDYICAYFPNR